MRAFSSALLVLAIVAVPAIAAPHQSAASGNPVIFSDDFSRDPLGRTPDKWTVVRGDFAVTARGNEQWLSLNGSDGEARMRLNGSLPGNWTLGFDLLHEHAGDAGVSVAGLDREGHELWSVVVGGLDGTSIQLNAFDYQSSTLLPKPGTLRGRQHLSISSSDGGLVVRLGDTKVASMPAIAEAAGASSIAFCTSDDQSHALLTAVELISNGATGASAENEARASH